MRKKKNTGNIMIILTLLLMITIGMYTLLNSELFETKNIEIVGNTVLSDDEIIKKLDIKVDLTLLLMITIGMYTLLNSELFETKNIEIVGNTVLSDDEIIKKLDIKVDKNIFMYNTNKMINKLNDNPYIEDVKIKRNIPSGLKVTIKEKEIYAILRDGKDYCYIDNQANFIEQIKDIEKDDIVKVDVSYIIEDNKVKFKDKEEKDTLIKLLDAIKECNLSKKINEINFEKSDIINIYTNDNIQIKLNKDNNIKYNISRSSAIMADLQKKSNNKGIVDLTYQNYAIYTP